MSDAADDDDDRRGRRRPSGEPRNDPDDKARDEETGSASSAEARHPAAAPVYTASATATTGTTAAMPAAPAAPAAMPAAPVAAPVAAPAAPLADAGGPDATARDDGDGPAPARWTVVDKLAFLLSWTPRTCRYDPENPPQFTMGLNVLFAFATTATVANLYYNQPVLYQMADTFGVSYEESSRIATLMQAGYASGIVLLVPVADILPRRPYILALVAGTALLWIGLCVTRSFAAFEALSFVCGFTTVTPQLMLPLVGELAPPNRRATALSIVVSGLSLGMMVARVLSGVVANFTSWRNIYWFSFGAQGAVFVALYFFMPDYRNKSTTGGDGDGDGGADDDDALLNGTGGRGRAHGRTRTLVFWRPLRYARMLYGGILVLVVRHATLLQACLIVFCTSAVFTSYWTTLSFLLASPPYAYPAYAIGLFGLIGVVIICFGPVYSRFVLERVVPLASVVLGLAIEMAGVGVGVGIGTFSVAGPVVQAILVDFGNQINNIALRTAIFGLAPRAHNRVNAAYMIASFTGQLTGTSAGNRLYAMGGWRYSGGLSLGFLGFALLVCLSRGPRETGWVGWHGGWAIRRDKAPRPTAAAAAAAAAEQGVLAADSAAEGRRDIEAAAPSEKA